MTVVITPPMPDPTFPLNNLCSYGIASFKYLASGKPNRTPVGSGPYTLDSMGDLTDSGRYIRS